MENNNVPEFILDEKDMIDVADRLPAAPKPPIPTEASPHYQQHRAAMARALAVAEFEDPASAGFQMVVKSLDASRDRWLGYR